MTLTKEVLKRHKWDLYFLKMVELVASKSEDLNTKVGCVLVGPDNQILSTGYNGFARGVKVTKARLDRDSGEKYYWLEHAERNAIYNACRSGAALKGAVCYTFGYPCPDCARGLIQSGITSVVMLMNDTAHLDHNERWAEQYLRSKVMLLEAGVSIRRVNADELRI